DSVFLVADGSIPSTFSSSDLWLHASSVFLNTLGSGLATFTFDPNTGILPRTGTLSLDDQTLTVTQAGSSYNAVSPLTTLVSSGLASPGAVAIDGSGNVYIADSANNAIKKWDATTGQVVTLINSGLNHPSGLAVDSSGNLYIADTLNSAVKKW